MVVYIDDFVWFCDSINEIDINSAWYLTDRAPDWSIVKRRFLKASWAIRLYPDGHKSKSPEYNFEKQKIMQV